MNVFRDGTYFGLQNYNMFLPHPRNIRPISVIHELAGPRVSGTPAPMRGC